MYAAGLAEVLGDNPCGVYLYGSLAQGCYHPATSGMDVIVARRERQNKVAARGQ